MSLVLQLPPNADIDTLVIIPSKDACSGATDHDWSTWTKGNLQYWLCKCGSSARCEVKA